MTATTVRVDPHVHTTASHDAEGTVHQVLAYAHYRDIDAVAITDHDTTVGARRALEVQHQYDVTVIPGVEISTAEGHLLGLGVRDRPAVGAPLAETVTRLRERGGVAVVPHPFQVSRHGVRKADIRDCDGIEVFNAWAMTGVQNRRADSYASRHHYPKLGGSDAHVPAAVGRASTTVRVTADRPTVDAILEAVRAGRTRPVGRTTSTRRYVRKYTRAVGRRLRSTPVGGPS
jgi:predicted metal-dependent phosphoesterase TrpH